MDISVIESLIFGFVSGITEFMPVSASAHEQILLRLFGLNSVHPLMQLFIHIGILAALFFSCNHYLQQISREEQLRKIPKRRRKRQPDPKLVMDAAFLKTACIPLILGFVFYLSISKWENLLPICAALLIVNGLILHIPAYFSSGNKDSRSMSRLDAVAFGIVAALGMLPGISRIGISASYGSVRAADHGNVYRWCLVLSIPALIATVVCDMVLIVTVGFAGVGFGTVLQSLIAAVMALLGATVSIQFVRTLAARSGLSGFAYYCWGAGLFAFILYLFT